MFSHFNPDMLAFLEQLAVNNDKTWFADNKDRYESLVREPALAFIEEMDHWIRLISPHYEAIPKKVGGSLMRVYRDVRFSKDKSPYKTNVGIQFRHELCKDVHAPGFYVHISPEEVFVGVGTWHPAPDALKAIRDYIVTKPGPYEDAIHHQPFTEHYEMVGDTLTRPPRGYDKAHPLIDEIKRKDFIGVCQLDRDFLYQPDLCERVARLFGKAQPLQRFLCDALQLRF